MIDEAINVRESVVDVIGQSALSHPKFIPLVSEMILPRVKDSGLSVRKKSITLLGKLCQNDIDDKLITEICVHLSSRLNVNNDEEDSIKDLVIKVFEELWFGNTKKKHLNQSILQIVDVVAKKPVDFKEADKHWLVQMVQKFCKLDSPEKKSSKLKVEKSVFKTMMDLLVSHIVKIDLNDKAEVSIIVIPS